MIKSCLKFLLLVKMLLAANGLFNLTFAQHPYGAFESIEVGLSGSLNVNENMFHDYYDPEFGGGVRFSTPFYFGRVEGLFNYWYYYGVYDSDTPNFSNIFTALGWGKRVELVENLTLFAGGLLGNSYLSFDKHGFFEKGESEISAGYYGRVEYAVTSDWKVGASAKRIKMFTFHRIDLTYLSFGISRKLESPQWVQNFFR